MFDAFIWFLQSRVSLQDFSSNRRSESGGKVAVFFWFSQQLTLLMNAFRSAKKVLQVCTKSGSKAHEEGFRAGAKTKKARSVLRLGLCSAMRRRLARDVVHTARDVEILLSILLVMSVIFATF